MWGVRLVLLVAMLSAVGVVCAQVDICYGFEDAAGNSRPLGWGALPNLDFHYVGIEAYDNTAHTGSRSIHVRSTSCYAIMPDEGVAYGADSVWLEFWYYTTYNTTSIDVGYLTDPNDSTTFHLLATLHDMKEMWHFAAVDLSSVPTGARIAFMGHDFFSDGNVFWLDDIYLTSSPCAAWGLRVSENRADSVRFVWNRTGNPTVKLKRETGVVYYSSDTSIILPRGTSAVIMQDMYVDDCNSWCTHFPHIGDTEEGVVASAYREAGHCVDILDYGYSNAELCFGTCVNPYMYWGAQGSFVPPGQAGQPDESLWYYSHDLNYNPWSDGGGMTVFQRTIPWGENVSIRVGNRLGDQMSSSMTHTVAVDTAVSDIMVVKYTMAMAYGTITTGDTSVLRNDTLHPAWFRIELMDDTLGQLPPAACNLFYTDMWAYEGWDEVNNTYKRRNFTGMAFDLSPYHGQQVKLRITANDGAVNNRWCYGYYTVECLKRNEVISGCGAYLGKVTLTMPYGFRYRWWREGESTVLDTTQNFKVAAGDTALYFCELIDRFNPACNTVVSRRVLLSNPQRTEYDTVVENQLPYTWHGVVFTGAGDTVITLPTPAGDCDTTLTLHLHVWPNQNTRQVLRVCPDEWPVVWQGHTFDGPDSVEVTYTDMHGADSVVTYVAVEAPAYELADTVVVCPWRAFEYGGVDYGGPVSFDTVLVTVDGCDSLVHVMLMPRDSAFTPQAWHSIDGVHWADTVPVVLCSNEQLMVVDSTQGGQSWHWVLGDSDSSDSRAATLTFVRKDSVETVELTLDVVSAYGCHDTVVWPVVVFPAPEAAFEWKPEHPMDVDAQMQLVNNTVPDSCSWLWLIGEDSLTTFAPYYRWQGYTAPGDVEVTLKTMLAMQHDTIMHTCSDTAVRQVSIVTCFLQFPSLVTPNGDGINDRWEVVNLVEMGLCPQNELWIYNQWGVRVFHAKDITDSDQFWDPNDLPCPDGTYYFRFMARNKYGIVRQNGVIEVLR